MMQRRDFLRTSTLGLGAAVLAKLPSFAAASGADAHIEILLGEALGAISPNIYGHFVEHLGGVVYDGIWVGENSKIPNIHGMRKDLVEHLRRIHAPVVRWPGGCFADSYDWKDGIGPREKRPRRTNFWAGEGKLPGKGNVPQAFEPNAFGTNEFIQFSRLTGAQPYLAANVRSLPAEDFYRWVEYCNSPAGSTSLAEMRAAAGFPEPFNVRYWGVGNEPWGCGGQFTPEEYATEFRRYTAWLPGYGMDPGLALIAAGPSDGQTDWTRAFLKKLIEGHSGVINSLYGLSIHHYSWDLARGRTHEWNAAKGDAVKFEAVDWFELLHEGDTLEGFIEDHWKAMGEFDAKRHVKLVVDEWGPWYKPGTEVDSTHLLGQMITLRDAVMSAATLDIFNRHPEKVAMANCAQLVNCLNSLFLAHEDKFVATPVFDVFEMYAPHQGGQGVRSVFNAPDVSYDRDGKSASFWGLKGSASLKEKVLTLTVVNPDVSRPRETEIVLRTAASGAAGIKAARVTTLTDADIHAHNTFENPRAVRPQTKDLSTGGAALRHTFPPASVSALQITLA